MFLKTTLHSIASSTTRHLFAQSFLKSTSRSLSFAFDVNKFNDVHIKQDHVKKFNAEANSNLTAFESTLRDSLTQWKSEKRSSVWFYLPIELSHLTTVLAKYGFRFHHAENDLSVLNKWLPEDKKSKIPIFATHQMGVSGAVYRPDGAKHGQLLVIKDKHMAKDVWKLPGGAADLGEDIQVTSMREVFEETGVKTNFCSVIGFRQQHNYPSAHGRSDLYVVCRLEPVTYEINACKDEIRDCKWMDIDELASYEENKLTHLIARMFKFAVSSPDKFDSIDMRPVNMSSLFKGRTYNFFHRKIDA